MDATTIRGQAIAVAVATIDIAEMETVVAVLTIGIVEIMIVAELSLLTREKSSNEIKILCMLSIHQFLSLA